MQQLQARLRELGYNPGSVDGEYGDLTFAAVRDFQRAYRLPADGVAGPGLHAVLFDDTLPKHRRYIVLAEMKPEASMAPGLRAMEREAASLSGVSVLGPPIGSDTAAASAPVPASAATDAAFLQRLERTYATVDALGLLRVVTVHTRRDYVPGSYPRRTLQRLIHGRAARRGLLERINHAATLRGFGALHLDLGHVRWGDGARFLALVRQTARAARANGKQLFVSLPLKDMSVLAVRLGNDLDYGAIAGYAHRIIIVAPLTAPGVTPLRPLSQPEIAARVRSIVHRIPPWRCLLSVSVGALVLPPAADEPARWPAIISHQKAMTMAYRSGVRPAVHQLTGRPTFRATYDDDDVTVWLQSRAGLGRLMDMVERYRLAGVCLSGLGEEDPRLWRLFRERWQMQK